MMTPAKGGSIMIKSILESICEGMTFVWLVIPMIYAVGICTSLNANGFFYRAIGIAIITGIVGGVSLYNIMRQMMTPAKEAKA